MNLLGNNFFRKGHFSTQHFQIPADNKYVTQIRTTQAASFVGIQPIAHGNPGSEHAAQPAFIATLQNPYRGEVAQHGDPFLTHSFDRKIIGWSQLGIPKNLIESLYSCRFRTGQEHSLFWHYSGYDIRIGEFTATESTTLGGQIFYPAEERFFGTKFLAHIHEESPLPSIRDFQVIGAKALPDPENPNKQAFATHTVFGFTESGPAFVQFTAIYNKRTDQIVFQDFRTSHNISEEMFDEVKNLAQLAAPTILITDAGQKVHGSRP